MSGCVVLTDDDLLEIAEAGLSGDQGRFLGELRRLGMSPFLVDLARKRFPLPEGKCCVYYDYDYAVR